MTDNPTTVTLVCVRPFGNFEPGDEVEVPKGAEFDTHHFEIKEAK